MLIPEEVYRWLVAKNVIPNEGQLDGKGLVLLADSYFQNGFNVAEIVKYLHLESGLKVPSSLNTVKNDTSKNSKLTNWNFIWLSFDSLHLKLDPRLKDLILQGQNALIVEILKQLAARDTTYTESQPFPIKEKQSKMRNSPKHTALDIKKINLAKNPQESESSLEFLILLLTSSLAMSVEEILGLFTNQNKYLAHIIVKGIHDQHEGVILFYTLLNKHSGKLNQFIIDDPVDAQSCLYALKPGFISKDARVAQLCVDLFLALQGNYKWFISEESKCANTLFLGIRRHPDIKHQYWRLLLHIISDEEVQFFTKHYSSAFKDQIDLIQITTHLIPLLAGTSLGDTLTSVGVVSQWINIGISIYEESAVEHTNPKMKKNQSAVSQLSVSQLSVSQLSVSQLSISTRILSYNFLAKCMQHLPESVEEEHLSIYSRHWRDTSLIEYTFSLNELIVILELLAECKSGFAIRIYHVVIGIFSSIYSDSSKKEHLVDNLIPLISLFPSIPSEDFISCYQDKHLSSSDFLLVCEVIEQSTNVETLMKVGTILKESFLKDPVMQYYTQALLPQITKKLLNDEDNHSYLMKMCSDVLSAFVQTYSKRKAGDSVEKVQTILGRLLTALTQLLQSREVSMKEKLLSGNAQIRNNNHKMGSKLLEGVLTKMFHVSKQEIVQYQEEFNNSSVVVKQQKSAEDTLKRSKAASLTKLRGPDHLRKEFEQITEKRKKEEDQKRVEAQERLKQEERKRINLRREVERVNIEKGLHPESILREFTLEGAQPPSQLELLLPECVEYEQYIGVQFSRHGKLLRSLFNSYSNTMFSNKQYEKFQDNQLSKEYISEVELAKLLKDIRITVPNLRQIIKEINIKIMHIREVHQLSYKGFEQFLIQYISYHLHKLYPTLELYALVDIFFRDLKATPTPTPTPTPPNSPNPPNPPNPPNEQISTPAVSTLPSKYTSISVPPEEEMSLQELNRQLQLNPNMILPEGYKKIVDKKITMTHKINPQLFAPSIAPSIAPSALMLEILSDILSASPLQIHLIEPIPITQITAKAKCIKIVDLSRNRAVSTLIQRKFASKKSTLISIEQSRGKPIASLDKNIHSSATNTLKIIQLEKAKAQAYVKKMAKVAEEKAEKRRIEKEEERKRRQLTEKYLQQQKVKLMEKRRREQEQKQARRVQELEQLQQKKALKEKFSEFHRSQLQKLKKLQQDGLQKQKKGKDQQAEEAAKRLELSKKLRNTIEQTSKKISMTQKEFEEGFAHLFEDPAMKEVFSLYEPNLTAIYEFLLRQTHLSLTERKPNNQLTYETWRYFTHAFELSPLIMHPKDIVSIFKILTRDKQVAKEHVIGLNFEQFQKALLRIAVKYHAVLDLLRIKEEASSENEFNLEGLNFKDILPQEDQNGNIGQVTPKTLKGLIHYLKVPQNKPEQDKRFRMLISEKPNHSLHNMDRLKDKLAQQYSLQVQKAHPQREKSRQAKSHQQLQKSAR